MSFIWEDSTYWERYKKSAKVQVKILIPILISNLLFWFILCYKSSFLDILLISFISGIWVFSLINIFFQFPNAKIPDYYSKTAQTGLYIGHFLIASIAFYFIYHELNL